MSDMAIYRHSGCGQALKPPQQGQVDFVLGYYSGQALYGYGETVFRAVDHSGLFHSLLFLAGIAIFFQGAYGIVYGALLILLGVGVGIVGVKGRVNE